MYEHVPVQRIVENIWHIYDLYRHAPPSQTGSVDEKAARMLFLRGLINNLRNERSRPSSRKERGPERETLRAEAETTDCSPCGRFRSHLDAQLHQLSRLESDSLLEFRIRE